MKIFDRTIMYKLGQTISNFRWRVNKRLYIYKLKCYTKWYIKCELQSRWQATIQFSRLHECPNLTTKCWSTLHTSHLELHWTINYESQSKLDTVFWSFPHTLLQFSFQSRRQESAPLLSPPGSPTPPTSSSSCHPLVTPALDGLGADDKNFNISILPKSSLMFRSTNEHDHHHYSRLSGGGVDGGTITREKWEKWGQNSWPFLVELMKILSLFYRLCDLWTWHRRCYHCLSRQFQDLD